LFSQIKSHFIFNSLTAIYDLCSGNTEAQEAIVAFSEYLRVSMGSVNQKKLISFDTELKYIKHYLLLEKLRYEEKLQVIYEIKANNFKVPLLSILPLIENAVSHGLFNKTGAGTIRIRTTESETEYTVTIVDDGIGFDANTLHDNEYKYSGIENIRSCIESMCGGTLIISSKPGVGTRVNINIPKGVEQ